MKTRTITLIRRLSQPITDVANLAIGQRTMQCPMNFFSKFEPNKSIWWRDESCHNLSLGFATKAKACTVASQKGSSGVTFSCSRECKRV
jgi:hypothetical protein